MTDKALEHQAIKALLEDAYHKSDLLHAMGQDVIRICQRLGVSANVELAHSRWISPALGQAFGAARQSNHASHPEPRPPAEDREDWNKAREAALERAKVQVREMVAAGCCPLCQVSGRPAVTATETI